MYSKLYNFYKWYRGYFEGLWFLFASKPPSLYQAFFVSILLSMLFSTSLLRCFGQDFNSIFEIDSAITAILAAILWLLSAQVRTPDKFGISNSMTFEKSEKGVSMHIGDTIIHPDFSQKMNHLSYALRAQGILSALAAICAALSAIYQTLLILIKHLS